MPSTWTTQTLAQLALSVARLVDRVIDGTATATEGVNTQLTDTVNLTQTGDPWVGGTVFLTSGTNINLVRPIVTHDSTNKRITFAAVTANVASGNSYSVVGNKVVEYLDLKAAINLALREMGNLVKTNDATAVVVNTYIYALPSEVWNIIGIEIVKDKGLTTERSYPNYHWMERDNELVFDPGSEPWYDGDYIRILYGQFHADLVNGADALDPSIDPGTLVLIAAKHALRKALMRFGKENGMIPDWLNERAAAIGNPVRPRNTPVVRVHSA